MPLAAAEAVVAVVVDAPELGPVELCSTVPLAELPTSEPSDAIAGLLRY